MSYFLDKRNALELFTREQIIGPGSFNRRFFLLNKWASNEFLGQNLHDCESFQNVSEVISEVPAYQYSSAILFPISKDSNDTSIESFSEAEDENDSTENLGDVKADDEEFEDDHIESVSSKNQNYPNTFGISFAVQGDTNLSTDLKIVLKLRSYKKLKQNYCKEQRLAYWVQENEESIARIIDKYFTSLFTTAVVDKNLFVCLKENIDINPYLYSLDYENLESLLKEEVLPMIDKLLPGIELYKKLTKTYDKKAYEFHSLYVDKLIDEICSRLKQSANNYSEYQGLIDALEIYHQVKEIITELKTIYRNSTRRSRPTPIWESSPFMKEISLNDLDLSSGVKRGEIKIEGQNNLRLSFQALKKTSKNQDGIIYLKLIVVNRSEIVIKIDEPPQLNKKDEANEKAFFGVHLSVSEVKQGILVPYNPPNLLDIDQEYSFTKLQYRRYKDYGEGYNTSIAWGKNPGSQLRYVCSQFLPEQEVPKVDFKPSKIVNGKVESRINEAVLSILGNSTLSKNSTASVIDSLKGFVNSYKDWIDEKSIELANTMIPGGKDLLERQLRACNVDYARLMRNVQILESNQVAMAAFMVMNTAMFMQLHHSIHTKKVVKNGEPPFLPDTNGEAYYGNLIVDYKWRSFQLAFILLNIDGFVRPEPNPSIIKDLFETGWPERNEVADLVWFPTGGGKTEAYLGIIAFAIAYRRFTKGETAGGTTILMRYTLRLLTLQQFQRATLLICALEVIRKEKFKIPHKLSLGKERITIGLFVGGESTPNKWSGNQDSMLEELGRIQKHLAEGQSVVTRLPHTECPWCGGKLFVDKGLGNIFPNPNHDNYGIEQKLLITCNTKGCTFYDKRLTDEDRSLPVRLFDEDIYKFPPTLLFGTVDKFAALANKVSTIAGERNQDSRRLFGKGRNLKNCPPDLIIQDELHLLLGPLGSAVGLFERAIEALCTYVDENGRIVKPKVITSTATTRNTDKQIFALFNRRSEIFPKQGINCDDSFFAYFERSLEDSETFLSNRKYLGVLPIGKTQVWMQLRVASICLAHRLKYITNTCTKHQILSNDAAFKKYQEVFDYYHTVLSYFNSLKEVGKTQSQLTHYLPGDVSLVVRNTMPWTILDKIIRNRDTIDSSELTGRLSGEGVKSNLSRIEKRWEIFQSENPPEFVVATNMISVGIDIARFNSMIINSMPRNTAEYIQASSRVAREREGIVFTVHHPFRSRDISHYQRFQEFHEKFYGYVEPISVTPFAMKALERYFAMYLAVIVRHNETLNLYNNEAAISIDQIKISTIKKIVMDQMNQIKKNAETLNAFLANRTEGINLDVDGIIADEELADIGQKLDELLQDRWLYRKGNIDPPLELFFRDKLSLKSLFNPRDGISLHGNWNVKQSLREIAPSVVVKTVQQ